MKKSSFIYRAVFLFIVTCFLITLHGLNVKAQQLSMNIVLDNEGGAIVLGSADLNPSIIGINFENGTLFGFTPDFAVQKGANWIFNLSSSQLFQEYYVKITLPSGAKIFRIQECPQ